MKEILFVLQYSLFLTLLSFQQTIHDVVRPGNGVSLRDRDILHGLVLSVPFLNKTVVLL